MGADIRKRKSFEMRMLRWRGIRFGVSGVRKPTEDVGGPSDGALIRCALSKSGRTY